MTRQRHRTLHDAVTDEIAKQRFASRQRADARRERRLNSKQYMENRLYEANRALSAALIRRQQQATA